MEREGRVGSAAPAIGGDILKRLQGKGEQLNKPYVPREELPIHLIDEDPNQPRKRFDKADLESFKESIQLVGILQPIGVRASDGGRYTLVWGARRLRAARDAGLTTIPVRHVPKGQETLTAQVIENQHRAALANSEIAAVVNRLFEQAMSIEAIGKVVNLPRHRVGHYRTVDQLCPKLRAILDKADMRALAELHRVWEKADETGRGVIESAATVAVKEQDYLTLAEARRTIAAARSPQDPPSPSPASPRACGRSRRALAWTTAHTWRR